MKSLIQFLKYNNAVPFITALLFLGAGVTFAANPTVREAIFPTDSGPIGPPPKAEVGKLFATDIENFKMEFRVDSVSETTEIYRVKYSYRTLEVVDNSWAVVPKTKVMEVSKKFLGKRDLGTYVAEQVGQVMDREVAYLEEAQTKARQTGETSSLSTKYSSLAGKGLNDDGKGFDGYKPVVKESSAKNSPASPASVTVVNLPESGELPVQTVLSKEEVRQIIVDSIAKFLAIDTPAAVPKDTAVAPGTENSATDPADAPQTDDSSLSTVPVE